MRFEPTRLAGAWTIGLDRHIDDRGWFARTFCEREFTEHGLPTSFPQSNLAHNAVAGTLRGMHFNRAPHGEAKIVRCVRGAIHKVIIDLRAGSPTRHEWLGIDLTADGGRALFVPEGFANGYITLVDDTEVAYQMGALYEPDAARGVRWNDPAFGIRWPRDPVVMSERDATYPDVGEAAPGMA